MDTQGERALVAEARPEPIQAGAVRALQPGERERLRRTVVLCACGITTALSVTFWLIGAAKDIDSTERIVVPLLTGLFAVLMGLASGPAAGGCSL